MGDRKLRSSVKKREKTAQRDENISRPFVHFNEKVEYFVNFIDCAAVCDEILSKAKHSSETFIIGFDMEWKFSFQRGSEKTALIQLCPDLKTVYLLHVIMFKSLPRSLIELLIARNVRLVGVNIKNDIRKLCRDFPNMDAEPILNNCIELGAEANKILPIAKTRWSMEKLVDFVLKMQINKSKKVRNSKWNVIPLSEDQKKYAATDAYVSLELYFNLKKMENEVTVQ